MYRYCVKSYLNQSDVFKATLTSTWWLVKKR